MKRIIYFLFSLLLCSCQNDSINENIPFECSTGDEIQAQAKNEEDFSKSIQLYLAAANTYQNDCTKDHPTAQNNWAFCIRQAASKALRTPNFATDSILSNAIDEAWWTPNHEVGKLYMQLGWYLSEQKGDYFAALKAYNQARVLHEIGTGRVTSRPGKNIYKPLGNIYTRLGENEEAAFLLKKAIDSLKQNDLVIDVAEAYSDLGIVYWNRGDNSLAIEQYDEGLNFLAAFEEEYAEEESFWNAKALLLANKAQSLLDQEKTTKAYPLIQESLELLNDSLYLPGTYALLANAYAQQQDYLQADHYYALTKTLLIQVFGEDRRELAKVELTQSEIDLERGKIKDGLAKSQLALSRVMKNIDAQDIFDNPDPEDFYPENAILEGLTQKGRLHLNLYEQIPETKSLEAAKEALELAISMEEYLREVYQYQSSQLQLIEESQGRHEQIMYVLYEWKKLFPSDQIDNLILQYAEKSRAIILNQALNQREIIKSVLAPESFRQLKELQTKINITNEQLFELQLDGKSDENSVVISLQSQLGELKRTYQVLREQYLDSDPRFQQIMQEREIVSLKAVQKFLPDENTMFLEYFYGEGAIYAFSVTKNDFQFEKIPIDDHFNSQLDSLTQMLSDWSFVSNQIGNKNTFNTFVQNSKAVYDKLLAPFFQKTPPEKLIIVPDGRLGYLPFDVLLTDSVFVGEQNFRDLPYLLNKSLIWHAHSATNMIQHGQRTANPRRLRPYLGIAPNYTNCSLPDIKYGEESVRTTKRFLGGKTLTNNDASISTFEKCAPAYKVIHFHGHAKGLNENPDFSWLAFTHLGQTNRPQASRIASRRNNQLLASDKDIPSEIERLFFTQNAYQLDLNAELIVLSACETGKGRIARGEGIISLARAFRIAGCPNTMMTLWEVRDEAAKDITVAYFQNLKNNMGKAEALHKAKLSFLKSSDPEYSAYPSFWAAFILVGDNAPIDF